MSWAKANGSERKPLAWWYHKVMCERGYGKPPYPCLSQAGGCTIIISIGAAIRGLTFMGTESNTLIVVKK